MVFIQRFLYNGFEQRFYTNDYKDFWINDFKQRFFNNDFKPMIYYHRFDNNDFSNNDFYTTIFIQRFIVAATNDFYTPTNDYAVLYRNGLFW